MAKALVNPLYREDCSLLDDDWSCSEDSADDFAAWVVMQGKPLFEEMLADSALLVAEAKAIDRKSHADWDESVDRAEYRGYQRADYIATPIYRARFDEELDQALQHDSCGSRGQ